MTAADATTATTGANGGAMKMLTTWVLEHKRLVAGLWLIVTIAAFAAIGPAGDAISQQSSVPGREGFETNRELAAI
jgi:hypothetical protein